MLTALRMATVNERLTISEPRYLQVLKLPQTPLSGGENDLNAPLRTRSGYA